MRENDYEYDYHNLAEDADYIEDEIYYDDGTDEAWMTDADDDESQPYNTEFQSYYSDIDELDD